VVAERAVVVHEDDISLTPPSSVGRVGRVNASERDLASLLLEL